MFVVIEGSDGSGKSSLVSEIASILREDSEVTEFHKGRPGEESRDWVLRDWVLSVAYDDWFKKHAVADRWHWGEVTYAPIKRPMTCRDRYGLLGASGWRWTELFMASRGIAQFWLYQPLEVIQRRVEARGDDFVNAAELEKIVDLYNKASWYVLSLAGKLMPSPDSVDDIPALAKYVVETAKKISDAAEKLRPFPNYIGTPDPAVLLVGDRPGGSVPITNLPFYPKVGNSAEFLLEALPETFWRSCGIINASEFEGDKFRALHEAIGRPRIVALGRLAEKSLVASGMYKHEYNVVAHPQYVRRFHIRDKIEYGQAIQRLSRETGREDPWILC